MALRGVWRYSWFCLVFLAVFGLDMGYSNSGKKNINYVVGLLFCYQECRCGVTGCSIQVHNFSFKLMFMQDCKDEWLYVCRDKGVGQ